MIYFLILIHVLTKISLISANKMQLFQILTISLFAIIAVVQSAKILMVSLYPSRSHQITFLSVCKELSLRGHQVSIVTTNPMRNESLTNLTEIDISYLYNFFDDRSLVDIFSPENGIVNIIFESYYSHIAIAKIIFENEDMKNLMADEKQQFDLIMYEAHCKIFLALGEKYNAPVIGK